MDYGFGILYTAALAICIILIGLTIVLVGLILWMLWDAIIWLQRRVARG